MVTGVADMTDGAEGDKRKLMWEALLAHRARASWLWLSRQSGVAYCVRAGEQCGTVRHLCSQWPTAELRPLRLGPPGALIGRPVSTLDQALTPASLVGGPRTVDPARPAVICMLAWHKRLQEPIRKDVPEIGIRKGACFSPGRHWV